MKYVTRFPGRLDSLSCKSRNVSREQRREVFYASDSWLQPPTKRYSFTQTLFPVNFLDTRTVSSEHAVKLAMLSGHQCC